MFFLFADDDVKTNNLELCFCKVFQYKCFIKKLYFGSCNLLIRKDLLERCLLEKIKSLVKHLQFMVWQKHNLVEHLILPQVFPSDRMSSVFFVWPYKFWFLSDIVQCPTIILRPAANMITLYHQISLTSLNH